jgi:hypothetical protein
MTRVSTAKVSIARERVGESEDSSLNLDAVRASLGEAASLLAQMGAAVRDQPDAARDGGEPGALPH